MGASCDASGYVPANLSYLEKDGNIVIPKLAWDKFNDENLIISKENHTKMTKLLEDLTVGIDESKKQDDLKDKMIALQNKMIETYQEGAEDFKNYIDKTQEILAAPYPKRKSRDYSGVWIWFVTIIFIGLVFVCLLMFGP